MPASSVPNKHGFGYLNGCETCHEDFSSVKMFDRHRIGRFEYTHSQGLRSEPPVEDGRRCLDEDEMRAKGWDRDERGRWADPAEIARTTRDFATRAPGRARTRSQALRGAG